MFSSSASILGFSFTLQRTNCKPLCTVCQPQNEGLIYHVIFFWFIFLFRTSFWVWGYKQNNLTVSLWLNKCHKYMLEKKSFLKEKKLGNSLQKLSTSICLTNIWFNNVEILGSYHNERSIYFSSPLTLGSW